MDTTAINGYIQQINGARTCRQVLDWYDAFNMAVSMHAKSVSVESARAIRVQVYTTCYSNIINSLELLGKIKRN